MMRLITNGRVLSKYNGYIHETPNNRSSRFYYSIAFVTHKTPCPVHLNTWAFEPTWISAADYTRHPQSTHSTTSNWKPGWIPTLHRPSQTKPKKKKNWILKEWFDVDQIWCVSIWHDLVLWILLAAHALGLHSHHKHIHSHSTHSIAT